jgi:hypothetical protein
MSFRNKLTVGALSIVVSMALAGAATAACVGSTCTLGGQLRAQIGNGLPIPISLNPAPEGDLRWGQPGQIKARTLPTSSPATVQQQNPATGTPDTAPRSLMVIKPSAFTYNEPLVSIGVVKANLKVFAVQTNLDLANPHPGTTSMGGPAPVGPFATVTLKAGGRPGASILSWCAGLPAPTASFNPGCAAANDFGFTTTTTNGAFTNQPVTNGLIRYTATKNQFGGSGVGRTLGTAMVFFNAGGLAVGDLPCTTATNPLCLIAISLVTPGTAGVIGAGFAAKVTNPAFSTATGVFTGNVGGNGTINAVGVPVTDGMGNFVPFTGQAATSWGFPGTTGKLTISVTQNQDAPTELETFTRTGGDNRTAGGSGIVVLVGGAVSSRSISGPNGNRSWATYNVPEPSAIAAASAGLFALLGCHQLVRRRKR